MHYCFRFAGVATAPAEPAVPILPKVDFAVALKAVSLETLSNDLWPSAKLAGELSAESSQPLSLLASWLRHAFVCHMRVSGKLQKVATKPICLL